MEVFWVKIKVNKILYSQTDDFFFIALADVLDTEKTPFYKVIKIKGNFDMLFEDDILKISGYFVTGKNNENIFNVENYTLEIQQEETTIIKFFQQEKMGIRKSHIKKLIEIIGISFISDIYNDNTIIEKFDFSEKVKNSIVDIINRRISYQEIINFLILNNLSPKYANHIFNKFKENSIKTMKENPYTLYYSAEIPFDRLDKLAYSMKIPYDFFGRIDVGIFCFIDINMDSKSHVYIKKSDILEQLPIFLKNNFYQNIIEKEKVEKVLQHLIKNGKLIEVEHNNIKCIYKEYIYVRQNFIIEKIKEKIKRTSDIDMNKLEYFLNKTPLSEEQSNAIKVSLNNIMSIITGGPGTGKTYTLKYLYQAIKYINPSANILSLAPTGRASRRIEEIVNENAFTIHRGIGLRYTKEVVESDFIDADYVIIDESSMIDLMVFYSLIKAIPTETKLIIVGDVNQLPSIGAGLVLNDLIDSNKIPTSNLTLTFRQKNNTLITYNSRLYIDGKLKKENIINGGERGFYFLNKKDNEIYKFLWKSINKLLKQYSWSEIMILTPIKNEFLGVYEINAEIQKRYNPNALKESSSKIKYFNTLFFEGDKVMHIKNDYERNIMNGCIGFIKEINEEKKKIYVEYDNSTLVEYSEENFNEIELAYACTIYKSQGSESAAVIFISSESMDYGLNRNSIYTAWTRAKEMVVTIGSFKKVIDSWNYCVKNERNSYLSKLI